MSMSKSKKYVYSIILSLLIGIGLYINFELDRDFLSQFGFSGVIVIISIVFFIGIKIISEFFFFRLKGIGKVMTGLFAVSLIGLSITSIFFIRVYKTDSVRQHKESVNSSISQGKSEATEYRDTILNQIKSLERQVRTKETQFSKLDMKDDKWLIYDYNKKIEKLNAQKIALLGKLPRQTAIKLDDKEKQATLHEALNRAFGVNADSLTLYVNLAFTVFVDLALLFLIYILSGLWNTQMAKSEPHNGTTSDLEGESERSKVVNLHSPVKRAVNSQETMATDYELIGLLQKAVNESPLKQADFAREKLGITKPALWKIMTGRTKTISQPVRERIREVV